ALLPGGHHRRLREPPPQERAEGVERQEVTSGARERVEHHAGERRAAGGELIPPVPADLEEERDSRAEEELEPEVAAAAEPGAPWARAAHARSHFGASAAVESNEV